MAETSNNLPWKRRDNAIYNARGQLVGSTSMGSIEPDEALANADLIVRAVNAHEALIAMVEELAGTISDDEDSTWGHKTDARKLLASLGR